MKKTVFTIFFLSFLFQVGGFAQCTVSSMANPGIGTYVTNQYSYVNCHRYIRTALLNGGVNMNTGDWNSSPNIHPNHNSIGSDDEFVIVCDKSYAEAICYTHLPGQPDHSALVLPNPGIITGSIGTFASTPGPGSSIYRHGEASIGSGGGTLLNYFAVAPKMNGDGSISNGQTKQYCMDNFPYVQSVSWSVSNSSLQIIGSSTGFCVDVKATCNNGGGTFTLTATVTFKGTGEVRLIEKKITVTCPPPTGGCNDNTLDGGPLYTFNYITPGVNHTIQMALGWSWSLSSGSPDLFQVSNGGKTVTLKISRGCVVLRASHPSCGSRTYIFCPGGFRMNDSGHDDFISQVPNNSDEGKNSFDLTPVIEVFPNPVSSELQIRSKGNQSYQVRIYSPTGKLIQTIQNQNRISVQNLPNGIYFFEIQDMDTDQRVLKRVVVAK